MIKLYYKNKLLNQMARLFENRRLFTPLQLTIYTLKDYGLWPDKLIALDAFCQTGLQWTRIFAHEAEYLEMWDIDAKAIHFAKKGFPGAVVCCGDSVMAFKEKKFRRKDYNFVVVDSPVPFMYPDGSFEHFSSFDDIFLNVSDKCVLIFDVVPDIRRMLARHPHPEEFRKAWIQARSRFYEQAVQDAEFVHPEIMTRHYAARAVKAGYKVDLATYTARNAFFGFVTLAISR